MKLHSVLLTEKACVQIESTKYTFFVDRKVKKDQLKGLFRDLGVTVKKIHSVNLPARRSRPPFKKVIVCLTEGDRIKLYPEF
jgi:ribosomal protein L23